MSSCGERREKWMNRAVAVALQNEFPCIKGVRRCFMCGTRYGTLERVALSHRYVWIFYAFVWSFDRLVLFTIHLLRIHLHFYFYCFTALSWNALKLFSFRVPEKSMLVCAFGGMSHSCATDCEQRPIYINTRSPLWCVQR